VAMGDVGGVVLERDDQEHRDTHGHGQQGQQAADSDQHLTIRRQPHAAAPPHPADLRRPALHVALHLDPAAADLLPNSIAPPP
jgi:hypothetical protein